MASLESTQISIAGALFIRLIFLVPVYHLQWQASQAKHYRGQQASIRPTWTLNDFIYSFPRRVYYLFPRSRPTPPQGTAHNWVFVWCRFDTAERHNGHIKQIAVTGWLPGGGGGPSTPTRLIGRQKLMWETLDTDVSNNNLQCQCQGVKHNIHTPG